MVDRNGFISKDELKSVASDEASMSFAYCDAITHQLVDVVQDRKMENLVRYFNLFDWLTHSQGILDD